MKAPVSMTSGGGLGLIAAVLVIALIGFALYQSAKTQPSPPAR